MSNDFEKSIVRLEQFKLVFEEHSEYFFACVEGDGTDSDAVDDYQRTIAAEISKRNYGRVMIKRDVPLTNNTGQHCGVIYKVRAWELRKIKYAFVDVKHEHLSSYNFALMYANQKGIEAQVFGDIPSAEAWLLT
ncbi:hypothetical protein BH20ACI2_BH20ACI2_22450 [soil metagenome]